MKLDRSANVIAWLACVAVLATFLSIETRLAGQPFDGEHEDNAVAFTGAARNHLRYGFSRTLGQDLQEPHTGWYGDLSVEHRYLHHPPGLSLTLAGAIARFGDTHTTARLTAAFFHLFSLLAVLYGAYQFIGGAWGAALAGAVFTLMPLGAFFGRSVDYQTFTLPFLLWSQVWFVMYRTSGRTGFRTLAIMVACAGGLFDWDVYFWMLTAGVVEAASPPPGRSRIKAMMPWAIAGAAVFALVVLQIALIAGSTNELANAWLKWLGGDKNVSASSPVHVGQAVGWFATVFRWQWPVAVMHLAVGDFTGPLLLAAACSVVASAVAELRGDHRFRDGTALIALSAAPGILYLFAVPRSLQHEYLLMPVAGAVCWAATVAVMRLSHLKRTLTGALLVACVWWTAGPWIEMYFGTCFAPYQMSGSCERPISFPAFGRITYRIAPRVVPYP